MISLPQMPLGDHCILITALKCMDESIPTSFSSFVGPTLSYSLNPHYVLILVDGDLLSAMSRYSYPMLCFNKLYLSLV